MTSLTTYETRIMDDIVAGMTQREIAEKQNRAHQTIESHISHVKDKLGARTTAQAAVIYARGQTNPTVRYNQIA